MPGDSIDALAGERGNDATRHSVLLVEYGLDKPLLTQYVHDIDRVLHGDLGRSKVTYETVMAEFLGSFPATIKLMLYMRHCYRPLIVL